MTSGKPFAGSQPVSPFSALNDFLNCARAFFRSLEGLEGSLRAEDSRPDLPDSSALPENELAWEGHLADAVAKHVFAASRSQWALVRLRDPVSRDVRHRAGAGLDDRSAGERIGQFLRELEQAAAAAPRPILLGDLQHDREYAALAKASPQTGSLACVALTCQGAVEGTMTLGFERTGNPLSPAEVELLAEAGRYVGRALRTHRRLANRIAGRRGESPRAVSAKSWRPVALGAAGEFPTFSPTIWTSACNGGFRDFSAAARSDAGDIRLCVSRLDGQGQEMAWEALALDLAFRAACALSRHPADLADLMSRAWMGVGRKAGSVRLNCCADAAESGREYIFAGSASHLLYENRKQTVSELYERLPESDGEAEVWAGQHVPLHSGDILILHTCDLPHPLRRRHDVHRQLAAVLAREGRRPIETVVRQVSDLLSCGSASPARESFSGGPNESPAPVVALLRAE